MTKSDSCNWFAGKARHRIRIEKPVAATDDYGGSDITWEELITVWGYAEPASFKEIVANDKIVSRVINKIIIRYRSDLAATDITGKYRIQLDDRYMTVEAVENLDTDMKTYGYNFQRLRCTENGAENG
jgi:SPP1 family predicted phage head-tail adaptor